nr:hypothetical protein [uncultured Allomuricauda sp.]
MGDKTFKFQRKFGEQSIIYIQFYRLRYLDPILYHAHSYQWIFPICDFLDLEMGWTFATVKSKKARFTVKKIIQQYIRLKEQAY